MATCDKCGNSYDKAFQVTMNGRSFTFDSFECAISTLAPRCAQCDALVIGHGLEAADRFFCCANCAQQAGERRLRDRV